jgi:hypothetical protein
MRLPGLKLHRWFWIVLIVFVAGCEDTPNRPDPITINIGGNAPGVNAFNSHTFTSDRRGIATATLRWTSGDLDFFATVAACNSNPFICGSRVRALSGGTIVETVTFGVTEGEVVRLWVLNFATPVGQGYTIEVVLE